MPTKFRTTAIASLVAISAAFGVVATASPGFAQAAGAGQGAAGAGQGQAGNAGAGAGGGQNGRVSPATHATKPNRPGRPHYRVRKIVDRCGSQPVLLIGPGQTDICTN